MKPVARGGKNLMVLGMASVAIAVATVFVALTIYHNSGDIYLDRSRPGFLPEKGEQKQDEESEYKFSEETKITTEALKKYVEEFEKMAKPLADEGVNFGQEAVSDDVIFGK